MQDASATRAILQAVVYADIFDYPLTLTELRRYAVGARVSPGIVERVVSEGEVVPRCISRVGEYFTLPGREDLVETRRRRARASAALWPKAIRYGRILGSLPFVRMVAVTGALSVSNAEAGDDIDYLVVTEPGRLWLCRAIVIGLVKAAGMQRDVVCPNYVLSKRALLLPDRNLFTAHEVVQMVPVCGSGVYDRLRRLNDWTVEFLPNAAGPPREVAGGRDNGLSVRPLLEFPLRSPFGQAIERWEMDRKVRRFGDFARGHPEASFTADWCKGHFDDHGQRVLSAFADRLRSVEVAVA